MKRLVLLFAGLLIGLTTASAQNHQKYNKHHFTEPITFIEGGIEFLIFPDGSFDYNTNNRSRINNSRRSSINISYRGPNTSINYSTFNRNRNIYVSRNRDGLIRRIGNIVINYNRFGQITRAGSVHLNYNRGRNGYLNQVGGLRVKYNRWGEIVNLRGQINRFNGFSNTTYLQKNRNRNNWDNGRDYDYFDDEYYHHKQNGKVKKKKKR